MHTSTEKSKEKMQTHEIFQASKLMESNGKPHLEKNLTEDADFCLLLRSLVLWMSGNHISKNTT